MEQALRAPRFIIEIEKKLLPVQVVGDIQQAIGIHIAQ
jgi:hypothetical protein